MVRSWPAVELDVPQRSGDVLCLPPARTFLEVARDNAARLNAADLELAGTGLGEVRRRLRTRVAEGAAAYGAEIGLAQPSPWPRGGPLIGTGHQPFLFHPGIWTKHLLIARLGTQAGTLSMAVDCDAAEDVGADVPVLADGLRIARETLLRAEPDVPYEALPAPAPPEWRAFLDRVDARLRTLPRHGVHDIFTDFMARTDGLRAPDLGSFLTLVRRVHEGTRPYAELPVSRLTRTPEFGLFVVHLLRHAASFAAAYNRHLDDYRARYNVRTAAQPFPNLTRDGPRIELPFWIIRDARRRPVFAEPVSDRIRLWAGAQVVADVPQRGEPDGLEGIEVRPKALAMTAFKRICVVDLFVHGVGGARYDRVTDAVLRDFFHLAAPGYAMVTSTLYLPLSEFDSSDEQTALRRRLLELQHNPERVLADPDPGQRELIAEKWALIRRLSDAALARGDRRAATRRIRDINEALSRALTSERAALEHRLAALETGATPAAATHRGYPFCFFPPQAVERLVDGIVRDGGGASPQDS